MPDIEENKQTSGVQKVMAEIPTTRLRLIMRHPAGTVFRHDGSLLRQIVDWRAWLWGYRNGYRFGIER